MRRQFLSLATSLVPGDEDRAPAGVYAPRLPGGVGRKGGAARSAVIGGGEGALVCAQLSGGASRPREIGGISAELAMKL